MLQTAFVFVYIAKCVCVLCVCGIANCMVMAQGPWAGETVSEVSEAVL